MTIDVATPRDARDAMVAAGAIFAVRHREDALGLSFTYRVSEGGDATRCREILAVVKAKPAPFYAAFRATVQDLASTHARGAA